jgi:hypothetical protein
VVTGSTEAYRRRIRDYGVSPLAGLYGVSFRDQKQGAACVINGTIIQTNTAGKPGPSCIKPTSRMDLGTLWSRESGGSTFRRGTRFSVDLYD